MVNNEAAIADLNALIARLTPADREYVDDLKVYMTTKSLWGNEQAQVNALTMMVQDLLEAEAAGDSAQTLFGPEPRVLGDSLLAQLPQPRLRECLALVAIVVVLSWVFLLLAGGKPTKAGMALNWLAFVLAPVVDGVGIWAIFKVMHQTALPTAPRFAGKRGVALSAGVIGAVTVAMLTILTVFPPAWATVVVGSPWNYLLLAAIALGYAGYVVVRRNRDGYPVAAMVVFLGGMTALEQASAQGLVHFGAQAGWFFAGVIAVGYVGYLAWAKKK